MKDLVRNPGRNDHFVQLYDELEPLARAVADYVGTGLRRGEAAIVIATREHRDAFLAGIDAPEALKEGRLNVLDADRTLERLMANGMPRWKAFKAIIGGLIAELQLKYPAVRAYGEMVDVLWQRGERDAAAKLEEYWNELGRTHAFSLFCAYRMDPLDPAAYGGPLECICSSHTHLLPGVEGLDEAVAAASRRVLDGPLAQILLSLAASHRPTTHMPAGQATLLWLNQNMPRAAEKILSELKAAGGPAD